MSSAMCERMARNGDQMQDLLREATARIERDREMGRQLTLLPDEGGSAAGLVQGQRPRGRGKALSQLREWMIERGLKMPEDHLAEIAGMADGGDALAGAIGTAERILAWAQDGAVAQKGSPVAPTMAQRVALLMQLLALGERAASALMPYVAPKITPDVVAAPPAQLVPVPVPMAAALGRGARPDPANLARDISPQARRIGPPPMPHEIVRNQAVAEAVSGASDGEARTRGASG